MKSIARLLVKFSFSMKTTFCFKYSNFALTILTIMCNYGQFHIKFLWPFQKTLTLLMQDLKLQIRIYFIKQVSSFQFKYLPFLLPHQFDASLTGRGHLDATSSCIRLDIFQNSKAITSCFMKRIQELFRIDLKTLKPTKTLLLNMSSKVQTRLIKYIKQKQNNAYLDI